jgi:predicted MFS family arabinose efflux permease
MGVDALSALLFGYLYDKKGLRVLIFPILLSSLFSPFIFLEKFHIPLLGMILWGIGMGAQESIMRASVSQLTPKERRATGYGIFNTHFGLFWFLGSLLLGFLYDYSISTLILVSMGLQLLSLPLLLRIPLPVRVKS